MDSLKLIYDIINANLKTPGELRIPLELLNRALEKWCVVERMRGSGSAVTVILSVSRPYVLRFKLSFSDPLPVRVGNTLHFDFPFELAGGDLKSVLALKAAAHVRLDPTLSRLLKERRVDFKWRIPPDFERLNLIGIQADDGGAVLRFELWPEA
ncbi:MAG: hypothetical protein PHI85_02175 [Victivallaceae bacterium]|nr:hypothetical protein [Victivallaceae bacterium]